MSTPTGYHTSRNYARLWELAQKQDIIFFCKINGEITTGFASFCVTTPFIEANDVHWSFRDDIDLKRWAIDHELEFIEPQPEPQTVKVWCEECKGEGASPTYRSFLCSSCHGNGYIEKKGWVE